MRESLSAGMDPNLKDAEGNAAIHTLVRHLPRKDAYNIIITLLVHSSAEVDITDAAENTPLHLAVKVRGYHSFPTPSISE